MNFVTGSKVGPISEGVRKAYWIGSSVAVLIFVAAGCVNIAVGPLNLAIFLVPLIEIGFAWFVLILLDGWGQSGDHTFGPSLFRRTGVGQIWTIAATWHRQIVTASFLFFIPLFFLLTSVVIFIGAVTGRINPM